MNESNCCCFSNKKSTKQVSEYIDLNIAFIEQEQKSNSRVSMSNA